MRLLLGLSALFSLLLPTTASAQATGGSRAADRPPATLESSVSAVIDAGATLYNNGDAVGCFRVYQGALLAYGPTLETSPETKRKVDAFLQESANARAVEEKAFALRKALDALLTAAKPVSSEKTVAPAMAGVASAPTAPTRSGRTLWTRLGGEPAVKAVVTELVSRVLADPAIDFTRKGKYPLDAVSRANFETLLVQYISEATGGPIKYAGRGMTETHKGMAITNAEFDAMLVHLVAILKKERRSALDVSQFVSMFQAARREIVGVTPAETPAPPATPVGTAATAPVPATKPLWDRLGGEAVMKEVVHDLLERSMKNADVDFTRGGKHPIAPADLAKLERRFVEFLSTKTGGPLKYAGKDMKSAHRGMAITENQYDTMNGDLGLVMKNRHISQELIDELITILGPIFDEIVEMK